MKDITIDCGIEKISHIFHIGDIHVRNLKRHKEYEQVFNRLYTYIQKKKTDSSVIYVAGDIVHSKTDISPELVSVVSEFFRSLAAIAPTIVIPGNHDCNLNNTNRLDALTPIINALQLPNLYYWIDTGIYRMGGIAFNVMSVFDSPKDFILADKFDAEYKIALHHGALHQAQTDLGIELSNLNVTKELFDGHDLVLLGDIHKRQFLQLYSETPKAPSIAYCGSLIQQSHGEMLDAHGLMVWDLEKRSQLSVDIKNDYGYYTLDVVDGVLTNWSDTIPKRPRLRVRVTNTDASVLSSIIAEIKTKRKVEEISIQKIRVSNDASNINKNDAINIRDVEVQNKLITSYLSDKYVLDSEILDGIRHINRVTNSKLTDLQISRNIVWIPKRFEFSNMFSYGEDNYIDFQNMSGMYGLFAANASGKSSLLDALSFCCFDKCSRTSKSIHVLNNKKNWFTCQLSFEIDGIDYIIERRGKRNAQGKVPVMVNFYQVEDNGDLKILNGSERDETNKIIRQYIGEYEDFVITAYSVQNNNSGFIDKSQRERKELLASFLDINIFENLYSVANEEIKDTATLLKQANLQNYSSKIKDLEVLIRQYSAALNDKREERSDAESLLNELNDLLLDTTSKLKSIDTTLKKPELIRDEIAAIVSKIEAINSDIETANVVLSGFQTDYDSLKEKIGSINFDALVTEENQLNSAKTEINRLEKQSLQLSSKIKHCNDLIDTLKNHEYDPECEYCIRNTFVQQANDAKNQLPDLSNDLRRIEDELVTLRDVVSSSRVAEKRKLVTELENTIRSLEFSIHKKESEIKHLNSDREKENIQLNVLNERLQKSIQQESSIVWNDDINRQLVELRDERNKAQTDYDLLNEAVNRIGIQMAVTEKELAAANAGMKELQRLEILHTAYQYYLECVSRDGIPYQLIEKALPKLEFEINNILSEIVDFNILLNTDGKNINGYIVYDDDNVWPIELVSGMERFISSLAIRTSLINISALPRTNFLVIDEGLGNLDSTMLTTIGIMFEYLKTQFQFIMMISHIDSSRDMADKHIELHKENGYSKLMFEP